jgi:hypothetical protein
MRDRLTQNTRKNWIAIVGALLAMCLFLLGYNLVAVAVFVLFEVAYFLHKRHNGEPWWT